MAMGDGCPSFLHSGINQNNYRVEEAEPKGIEEIHDLFTKLSFADGGAGVQRLLQQTRTIDILKKHHSAEHWNFCC
jgi:hypothetical protein